MAAATLAGMSSLAAAQDYSLESIGKLPCRDAIPRLKEGRDAGSADAMYLTAQMVVRRICFVREYDVYARWLTQAAERGHRGATVDLGYAYALGDGVEQDYERAGRWLRRGGVDAQGEADDYRFGLAYTLARQVRAGSRFITPQWLTRDHGLKLSITVRTQGPKIDASVEHDEPEPGDTERSKLLTNVREGLDDAVAEALRKIPKPRADRVGDGSYRMSWRLVAVSSRRDSTSAPRSVDEASPR